LTLICFPGPREHPEDLEELVPVQGERGLGPVCASDREPWGQAQRDDQEN